MKQTDYQKMFRKVQQENIQNFNKNQVLLNAIDSILNYVKPKLKNEEFAELVGLIGK